MLSRRILWNLVGFAVAIWLLSCLTQSGKLLEANWELPEHILPGTPVCCHLRICSWLKPSVKPRIKFEKPNADRAAFAALLENLTIAHEAEVHWDGLRPLGSVWQQTVTFIPTTPGDVPSTPVAIGIHPLTLPSFSVETPTGDTTPQLAQPPPERPSSMKTLFPLLFIGLFIFCAILHTVIAHHLKQSPLYRLRKLKATPEALDKLPEILLAANITPQSHPDFYKRLSSTRFGDKTPDEDTIRALLQDAELLILQ